MATLIFTNFATTVISSGISDVDTSVPVAAGTGALFPNPGVNEYAILVLESPTGTKEVVHLTSRAGDVLTVDRGQESTAATSFVVGSRIEVRMTAGWLDTLPTQSKVQDSTYTHVTSVAGTDTITGTLPTPFTAYVEGQEFTFVPANTNTGAVTVNWSGLGAKAVQYAGAAMVGGELVAGVPVRLYYNGTLFEVVAVSRDVATRTQVQNSTLTHVTSVAGTDTITGTVSAPIAAYAEGQEFTFVPANTNTGAVTVNWSSLGVRAVQLNGAALQAGDLAAGVPVRLYYNGTLFEIVASGNVVRSPLTTAGDIWSFSGGDNARIALGNAGDVLRVGAADFAEWVDPGNFGFVYVESALATTDTSVDFTDIDNTRDQMFVFDNVYGNVDGTVLRCRTSSDSGPSPTFVSGAGNYVGHAFQYGSAGTTIGQFASGASATYAQLSSGGPFTGANFGFSGHVVFVASFSAYDISSDLACWFSAGGAGGAKAWYVGMTAFPVAVRFWMGTYLTNTMSGTIHRWERRRP